MIWFKSPVGGCLHVSAPCAPAGCLLFPTNTGALVSAFLGLTPLSPPVNPISWFFTTFKLPLSFKSLLKCHTLSEASFRPLRVRALQCQLTRDLQRACSASPDLFYATHNLILLALVLWINWSLFSSPFSLLSSLPISSLSSTLEFKFPGTVGIWKVFNITSYQRHSN